MVLENNITVLDLKEVSIGYNKVLYQGIDASVKVGEVIGIIGANGVGKSTLLRSIAGEIKYREGKIELLGKLIEKYSANEIAKQLSYVTSQSPRINNFSLLEMVSAGCYQRADWLGNIGKDDFKKVVHTIELVGLKGLEERDTAKLSDGEFQRAVIARSIVQNSKIILLDEPTAFLDIANKITITKLLKEIAINEDKAIVYSTHDLIHAIKYCDKIWIMGYYGFQQGSPLSLKEKGAFEKIFKDPLFIGFDDYLAGLF